LLYLLDANVLIDANDDYYPFKRVPEFWGWLLHMGLNDLAKIPLEVYEEVKAGDDDLSIWAKKSETEAALLFVEVAEVSLVSHVMDMGYAPDLTDVEIEKIGRDPFLIAYALASKNDRCIVTTENSKPTKTRANRHIPDVCNEFGISCCDTFKFARDLDFSTDWESKL